MKLTCDLRHEAAAPHDKTASSFESRYDAVSAGDLRDGPWLSPNARRQLEDLKGARWAEALRLADRIEAGAAFDDEAEHDVLYETYPLLIDTVLDLFNMVSRRDEQIARRRQEADAPSKGPCE